VPIGGIVGGLIGVIEGDIIGQIVGGQIGGKSIAFWQRGCMCPLTHWQIQSAVAALTEKAIMAMPSPKVIFIGLSLPGSASQWVVRAFVTFF
jgi:hypothetical protein